jgi:glycosyltransferase involved in cell wall biosynthesis
MTDWSIVTIIPLLNGARWIGGAVHSVFAQTVQSDEFIVVDDGSIGDGSTIVAKLARERPNTLLHKPNTGQSAARNFAVARSKSVLIALLDQDDRWYPNHLEVLRREFEKRAGMPLGWAYSDFDDIDASPPERLMSGAPGILKTSGATRRPPFDCHGVDPLSVSSCSRRPPEPAENGVTID